MGLMGIASYVLHTIGKNMECAVGVRVLTQGKWIILLAPCVGGIKHTVIGIE